MNFMNYVQISLTSYTSSSFFCSPVEKDVGVLIALPLPQMLALIPQHLVRKHQLLHHFWYILEYANYSYPRALQTLNPASQRLIDI